MRTEHDGASVWVMRYLHVGSVGPGVPHFSTKRLLKRHEGSGRSGPLHGKLRTCEKIKTIKRKPMTRNGGSLGELSTCLREAAPAKAGRNLQQ